VTPRRTSDLFWATGRIYMGLPARLVTRARAYGRERVPREGGVVLAVNHLHWIDVPILGATSPRNLDFVAKAEAINFPGLGKFLSWHGTIGVRRGESDREAVRQMREAVRNGHALGLFVEGTRQRAGRPGKAQPGAAMVAIQEEVPVVPAAIYGTQYWKPGNFAPCSIAFGRAMYFAGRPKNGRSYKEATAEIETRINDLFDWLAGVHARGRTKNATRP
jgi:1-acyl-sn-glycerol-3-phosphate acyltransferase